MELGPLVKRHAVGPTLLASMTALIAWGCSPAGNETNILEELRATEAREISSIPAEARNVKLRLSEDLRISGPELEGGVGFLRLRDIAVDAAGQVFILDQGAGRVYAYSERGAPTGQFGASGEGPGEFVRPDYLAVAGTNVAVYDSGRRTLLLWTATGEFLQSNVIDDPAAVRDVQGLDDGTFIIYGADVVAEGEHQKLRYKIRRVFDGGRRIETLAEIDGPAPPAVFQNQRSYFLPGIEVPSVRLVAAPGRAVLYVVATDAFVVHAMTPAGTPLWQVQIEVPRRPLDDESVAAALAKLRERGIRVGRADVDLPSYLPTVDSINVDGEGNLYVFLAVGGRQPGRGHPVDVFSIDGSRIMAGLSSVRSWVASYRDYVYAIHSNGLGEDQEVVRYRMIRETQK